MRVFEILLVGLALLTILQSVYGVGKKPSPVKLLLPAGVALSLLWQAWFEGVRWQMFPAYGVAGFSFLWALVQVVFYRPPVNASWLRFLQRLARALALFLSFLLLIVAVLFSTIAPVFQIPSPGGPASIGTQDIHLVDTSRPELFTDNPNDFRELLVRVWYPASPAANAVVQPYWPEVKRAGPLLLERLELPTFLLNYMALVPSHSYINAPILADLSKYPVLVFSHGYTDDLSGELTLMEEFASHGYLVFAINHPYEALTTEFPDGRVVLADPQIFSPPYRPQPRQVNLDDQLDVWVQDTRFVLDQLEEINAGRQGDFFSGHLDLEKIGVFGFSFGGATAVEVCLWDHRCQAGANMDGSQFGYTDFHSNYLKTPFLFFYNESSEGMNDHVYTGVENSAYRVTIAGTTHFNFTDKVLWSPYLKYADQYLSYGCGPIDAQRITEIKRAYLLAFFDRHLKGNSAPLLDGPSASYPEVHFQFRSPFK